MTLVSRSHPHPVWGRFFHAIMVLVVEEGEKMEFGGHWGLLLKEERFTSDFVGLRPFFVGFSSFPSSFPSSFLMIELVAGCLMIARQGP